MDTNKISNLAKCTFCDAEMIERTNDNTLECLNCGTPFTMPVKSTVKEKRND
jgi:ribosomal protein L37AE/L43A